MNFESIIKRIKEYKGLRDDQEVATILGFTKSAFSERKRRESIPKKELELFCERESINIDWLLTGEGQMHRERKDKPFMVCEKASAYNSAYNNEKSDLEMAEIIQILKAHPQDKELVLKILSKGTPAKVSATADEIIDGDFIFIPQVSGEISAGGGLLPDNTIEMKIAFKKDWIERKGDPRNMSLIRVSGDSMEPTLLSGDLVLVDHNRNCVDPQGGIYALSMDNMIMIKRVQMMWHLQKLKIISDNMKYESIETSQEQVSINGKVIWFGREIER